MNPLLPLTELPLSWPLVLVGLLSCGLGSQAMAEPPRVTFNTSYTAECVDVTPPEFALTNPDERIVEARFRVSVLLDGSEDDLEELLLVVSSPERRLRVIDFLPKTETFTEVEGPIEVVENTDKSHAIEAKVGGGISAHYGVVNVQVAPSLGGGVKHQQGVKQTYRRLPPHSLSLASGTTQGEHGVFFKLKPSSQATLEGAREYVCAFVVPRHWQADWVLLTCEAKGFARHYLSRRLETCGESRVYVGLYQQGDAVARVAANHLAEAQARLHQRDGHVPALMTSERSGAIGIASRWGELFAWCDQVNPFDIAKHLESASRDEAGPSSHLQVQAALEILARLAGG